MPDTKTSTSTTFLANKLWNRNRRNLNWSLSVDFADKAKECKQHYSIIRYPKIQEIKCMRINGFVSIATAVPQNRKFAEPT